MNNNQDEATVDLAAERLRKKMIRLMVISIGSMFIGIFAVLFAIVYKINNAPSDQMVFEHTISLPDTFQIEESQFEGNRLMVRGLDGEGSRKVMFFNLETGAQLGTLTIE